MIGLKVIKAGERAAVWDQGGSVRCVDGPKLVWAFGKTFERLKQFNAGPGEYLMVRRKDGSVKHVPGPAAIWWEPLEHVAVETHRAIPVDSHEAIVAYVQRDGGVKRRVVRGPEMYIPSENEWVHEFAWHGADPKNPNRKIPYALKFNKLRTIPDQIYIDVADVRTADDALLTIKLMIFFELVDLDRMLDSTHDPVADFLNTVSADVIDFVAGRTFESFKQDTEKLNDMKSYETLVSRSETIGYRIHKVVYRGYHATDALQTMHDNAIEVRTQLKLEAETQEQSQELEDLKVKREAARATDRRKMEELDAIHRNGLARIAHDEKIRQETENWQQALEKQKTFNLEEERSLAELAARGVDLTRYLVSKQEHPAKIIRMEGPPQTRVHLHEN